MSKNPYDMFDGASQILGSVGSAASAATPMQSPMGGVQNAQAAYHMHQLRKIQVEGMKQAVVNEEKAIRRKREMQTAQVEASDTRYGKNGITEENRYYQNGEGRIYYDGSAGQRAKS